MNALMMRAELERLSARLVASQTPVFKGEELKDASRVAAVLRPYFEGMTDEAMLVVPVTSRLVMCGEPVLCGQGFPSFVRVDPREVFEVVLGRRGSTGFFLAHNHPSGGCEPSLEDRNLTRKLQGIGGELGVRLLDHLVFGDDAYFSIVEGFRLPYAP